MTPPHGLRTCHVCGRELLTLHHVCPQFLIVRKHGKFWMGGNSEREKEKVEYYRQKGLEYMREYRKKPEVKKHYNEYMRNYMRVRKLNANTN